MLSHKPNIFDYSLFFLISLIAASTFAGIKFAVEGYDIYQVTFGRSLMASLALWPFALLFGKINLKSCLRSWILIILISLFGSLIPFTLLNWSGQRIPSALSGLLWATLPFFGVILVHFFTDDEKFSSNKGLGLVLGFLAVFIVSIGNLSANVKLDLLPQIAVVLSALCYALAGLFQRRLKVSIDPLVLSAMTMSLTALLSFIFFDFDPFIFKLEESSFFGLFYLALVPTAALQFLRMYLIKRSGYTLASYTGFTVPVFAVFIGLFALNEDLPSYSITALAMLFIALILSQKRS